MTPGASVRGPDPNVRLPFRVALLRKLLSLRILRVTNGHYYSPVPSLKLLRRHATRIFDTSLRNLAGVDLNVSGQLDLVTSLARFQDDQPFTDAPSPGLRYYFANYWFGRADALFLYSMLRHFQPRRIIEIGSGFSSAVMLDTNERFFGRGMQLTFIEPDARRLRALLHDGDRSSTTLVERPIQDVDPAIVDDLRAGDILFIDSSHVSKAGSDVNHILFELLPRLAPGVLVHFHDIHYPFEYPQEWFELGLSWNEPYLLRAFLQYNSRFTIRLWTDFLTRFHEERVKQLMPLCLERPLFGVGGSLWLQRV
jgi:predicted O-methyltransferase YrrM